MKFVIALLPLLLATTFAFSMQTVHNRPLLRRGDVSMASLFASGPLYGARAIPATKKIAVVTGTTSGLGKATMKALLDKGNYYVIAGVRDPEKMERIAEREGYDPRSYSVLPLDLASFESTRSFVKKLNGVKKNRPLERLVCNAAVYQPALAVPKYTADGFEEQLQINHLSHFLLCSLLLNDMKKAKDPRMIIVGSITGNDNTVGGGVVLPLADLGDLKGLKEGGQQPIAMVDGATFNGAKAYKDSKMCNMMTANELHKRYHASTGITFSTMYPGCIAETQLFREKRSWFRKLFPVFMKYVTGGYVGEAEAGERLAAVVDDNRCKKSGVYWAWNGSAKTVGYLKNGKVAGAGGAGGDLFENKPSAKVRDEAKANLMWDYSTKITGAKWPSS